MVRKDDWRIDSKKAAFVIIDMQRAFLEPGSPVECAEARDFVHRLNELTALCRRVGVPVIHVFQAIRQDLSDIGLLAEIRPRTDSEWEAIEGRKGAEFYKGINIGKGDYIVKKVRYSAFIPGSSRLEPLLRGLGRDSLIVCGVVTDICVMATAIDAMMLDLRVFLVGELTATLSEERQRVALKVLGRHFARVMTFEQVRGELEHLLAEAKSPGAV